LKSGEHLHLLKLFVDISLYFRTRKQNGPLLDDVQFEKSAVTHNIDPGRH